VSVWHDVFLLQVSVEHINLLTKLKWHVKLLIGGLINL